MTTITITIPNKLEAEVEEAFQLVRPCPDITVTPADWVKQCINDLLKGTVLKARKMKAQASVEKTVTEITID